MHSYNDNINVFERFNFDKNIIDFSALKEFHVFVQSKGFSIKYVIEGVERYDLNGKNIPLNRANIFLRMIFRKGKLKLKAPKRWF